MMDVGAIRFEHLRETPNACDNAWTAMTLAQNHAPDDGDRRFTDWQREDQQRNAKCECRRSLLSARNCRNCQQESDEQAARIAKEDPGGVKVVSEEADDRADQRDEQQRPGALVPC